MNLRKIILVFLYTLTGQAVLEAAEVTTEPTKNDVNQYIKIASGMMADQCGPFGFLNCFDGRCSCYLVLTDRSVFYEASRMCTHYHGQLATLSSQDESEFVASLLKRMPETPDAWIGLHRNDSSSEFEWVDKSAVTFSALTKDERAEKINCVRLTMQNNWVTSSCYFGSSYVCEVPYESTEQEVTCHPGWAKFGNYCYQPHQEKRTWDEAQEHCQCLGSNLLSIHSYKERVFIRDLILRSPIHGSWIGLRLDLQTKEFNWVDGTVKDYIDWKTNQPDVIKSKAECATIANWDRRWNQADCSYMNPYICKKDINPKKA